MYRPTVISFLFTCAVVATFSGCALPSRPTSHPYADAPSLVDVAALMKFDGRLPLVTIPKDNTSWGPSVKYAVTEALRIKSGAEFRVDIVGPASKPPSAAEREMSQIAPLAAQIADAVVADGAAPKRVSLGATTPSAGVKNHRIPTTPEIVVFAK
jgi:hypothetical protein